MSAASARNTVYENGEIQDKADFHGQEHQYDIRVHPKVSAASARNGSLYGEIQDKADFHSQEHQYDIQVHPKASAASARNGSL